MANLTINYRKLYPNALQSLKYIDGRKSIMIQNHQKRNLLFTTMNEGILNIRQHKMTQYVLLGVHINKF